MKVTVELLPADFYKSDQKMIKIDAYDHTNRETITNASFKVQIFNDNQLLLDEWFYTQDGNLILEVDPDVIVTNRNTIEISGEKNSFGLWEKTDTTPLIVTGPIFDEGGIYTFKIILDAQDEVGIISDVEFEVQVSVTNVTYYQEKVGERNSSVFFANIISVCITFVCEIFVLEKSNGKLIFATFSFESYSKLLTLS